MRRFNRKFSPLATVLLTTVHAAQILRDIEVYNRLTKLLPEKDRLQIKLNYFDGLVVADEAIERLQAEAKKTMCI
jgi:succinyl-CoA synthetase alpha subunit